MTQDIKPGRNPHQLTDVTISYITLSKPIENNANVKLSLAKDHDYYHTNSEINF